MKAIAFVVLMFITVGAVSGAAWVGERWFDPGLERGIVMAVLAGFVVFPIARWFEHKGWISGSWRLSKDPADNPPPVDPAASGQGDPAASSSATSSSPASSPAGSSAPTASAPASSASDASTTAPVAPPPSSQSVPTRGEPR